MAKRRRKTTESSDINDDIKSYDKNVVEEKPQRKVSKKDSSVKTDVYILDYGGKIGEKIEKVFFEANIVCSSITDKDCCDMNQEKIIIVDPDKRKSEQDEKYNSLIKSNNSIVCVYEDGFDKDKNKFLLTIGRFVMSNSTLIQYQYLFD
jgi:hypothetical protein